MARKTLVIGDVHGHYDRLEALLQQEGILELDQSTPDEYYRRVNNDVTVVQLGDLGHFGRTGSPTGDSMCLIGAAGGWIDVMLWGNHDRAVVDPFHVFEGYQRPAEEIVNLMKDISWHFAVASHGFLITHAGLAKSFDHGVPSNLAEAARYLNSSAERAVVRAVGRKRGGSGKTEGGILWRDRKESLSSHFKQIFGHSSLAWEDAEPQQDKQGNWNIDIGNASNGRLAGIWLPEEKVVTVDLGERIS